MSSRPTHGLPRREFLTGFGIAAAGAGLSALPWIAAGSGGLLHASTAQKSPPRISVSDRVRVTRGPARHRAFPSLVLLKDGTLLILYREGSDHWETDDAVVKLTRSTDGGVTWSEPKTIMEEKGWGFAAHHGAKQLADGSILAPMTSVRHVQSAKSGFGTSWLFRVFTLRSRDGGRTWDAKQIGPMPGWLWQNQYGRVMEIDGKLWVPGGGQREVETFWRNGYFVSHDNGQTWPEWHTAATGLEDEKDIVELPDGRLLAMYRSGQETFRSYSPDRGQTWTKAEKLDIFGQCPSLLRLPFGDILFAYRQVRPSVPKGVGLAVSRDHGQAWSEMEPLYVGPNADCAYPSMVVRDPDEALCAYYTGFVKGDCHVELARIKIGKER